MDKRMAESHGKAIAWLYKTGMSCALCKEGVGRRAHGCSAFNAGVQGANGWDPKIVGDLFDKAATVCKVIQVIDDRLSP